MSASKSIDKICVIIVAVTLIIALIFCNGQVLCIGVTAHAIGYENRIFDRTKVHTLDIVMNDWDSFLETCENEEYAPCNVVIDGEAVKNIGIRAKGNTSLSSVRNMGSSRYSFKLEFDQYDSTKSYHGLDKLCLNNIIQDNTYMKDYLAYSLMYDFGVDAPLCSYVYITVNGSDWGLYLAVEAIEDSFLKRNYGKNYGDLYKPDSMSFGGGRGNGMDFKMSEFMKENGGEETGSESASQRETQRESQRKGFKGGNFPGFPGGNMPEGMEMPEGFEMPEDFDFSDFDPSEMFGKGGDKADFGGFGGFGGMGSSDVKLQYIDDDPDSYSNIFSSAKTNVTKADQARLIQSLKTLSEGTEPEAAVNTDEVIRYFAVHDFLCNGDSYTGQMIHNYYLYEKDGLLSMIPWDYNLAYGSFQGSNASSSVNAAIDTPVSGDMSDRPMIAWIFDSEEYTAQYHSVLEELVSKTDFAALVNDTAALIEEYVEKDPTKFCTYEEFEKGVSAISQFCTLRAESVKGQLNGSIPSTSDGQKSDSAALIDASSLNISDMGTMNNGGGFGGKQSRGDRKSSENLPKAVNTARMQRPDGNTPEGFDPGNMPGGEMPEDFDPSSMFGGEMPEGFDPSNMPGGEMPEGFDPSNMPGGEMPEGFDPDSMIGGEKTEGDDSSKSEGFTPPNGSRGDSDAAANGRPQMGSFPGMGGTSQKDLTASYILLGISALFLLAGIAFAAKYKR